MQLAPLSQIFVNGDIGSIGFMGSPNDPFTLNGKSELSIATRVDHLAPFYICTDGRQCAMAIALAPMELDVANGDRDRHLRHSLNLHWGHSLSPMAPNHPFTKLSDPIKYQRRTQWCLLRSLVIS